jgi:tetrapyrrole methylase family protein/MazG family protein
MSSSSVPQLSAGARFFDVVELMNRLLAPDGCPWDREQTLESLRPYLLEEAHEVLEALEAGDRDGHCEELGDLLFQIVFQSALREREGAFSVDDVCTTLVAKMKHRHPHVFADAVVRDAAEQIARWQVLKQEEKEKAGKKSRTLDGVPVALPALLRAQRLGEKAAGVGFDWPDISGVRDKVAEELRELDEAMATKDKRAITHELGDLLFTLTRLAAKLDIGPEEALRQANARFVRRYSAMEDSVQRDGRTLQQLTLDEMNVHWEQAKRSTAEASAAEGSVVPAEQQHGGRVAGEQPAEQKKQAG